MLQLIRIKESFNKVGHARIMDSLKAKAKIIKSTFGDIFKTSPPMPIIDCNYLYTLSIYISFF